VALLRVATFNLLHGMSPADGSTAQDALRAAATAIDADVVGLQEVDRHQPRSGNVDQTEVVAGALAATHWHFAPAVRGTPGAPGWAGTETRRVRFTRVPADGVPVAEGAAVGGPTYGVALISRPAVRDWTVRRFPAAPIGLPLFVPGQRRLTRVPDEPRAVVAGVVETAAGPVSVASVHLSFVPGWNLRQLRGVVALLARMPRPRLLLGDLNLPGTASARATGWRQLGRVATYPAHRPRVQLDHVLADGLGAAAVRGVRALPLPVSDHCALVVDLEL